MQEEFTTDMVGKAPLRLAPGQTRPLAFNLRSENPNSYTLRLTVKYKIEDASSSDHSDLVSFELVSRSLHEPHKMTFLHPSNTVSYAILRPPSKNAIRRANSHEAWPVMLNLHGAGVEADSRQVRNTFDTAPDLRCWLVCPTGMTPWSGDDWRKSFTINTP